MKESKLRSNVTGSQDISKTMAATGRNTSKWSSVDNSLVRLVYQNRHIVERATSGVTREMKNIAWTHIANLLKIRQIARKSPKELRNRWYRLKQTCNKGLSFVIQIYKRNEICFILLYLISISISFMLL